MPTSRSLRKVVLLSYFLFCVSVNGLTAHLSCIDELKRTEGGLQVRGVCLEVVESSSDAGLEFGWVRTGWALGRNLLEGSHLEVVVEDLS